MMLPSELGTPFQLRNGVRTCGFLELLGRGQCDVRRLWALRPLAGLEVDLRPFGERLEAVADDVAVMHEQVLAGIIRRDEPVTLRIAEPLNGSGCHKNTSLTTNERAGTRLRPNRYSLWFSAASVAQMLSAYATRHGATRAHLSESDVL